jgi:hypothetical protein
MNAIVLSVVLLFIGAGCQSPPKEPVRSEEQVSRSEEQVSRSEEEVSRPEEQVSRSEVQVSRSEVQVSRSEVQVSRPLPAPPNTSAFEGREAAWVADALEYFRAFSPPERMASARMQKEGSGFNVTLAEGPSLPRAPVGEVLHGLVRFAGGEWICLLGNSGHRGGDGFDLILAMTTDGTVYWIRDHVCLGSHMHLYPPPAAGRIPATADEFLRCKTGRRWERMGTIARQLSRPQMEARLQQAGVGPYELRVGDDGGYEVKLWDVHDLSGLVGLRIAHLRVNKAFDLRPLRKMKLRSLSMGIMGDDLSPIRGMASLRTINGKPAAVFWETHDRSGKGSRSPSNVQVQGRDSPRITIRDEKGRPVPGAIGRVCDCTAREESGRPIPGTVGRVWGATVAVADGNGSFVFTDAARKAAMNFPVEFVSPDGRLAGLGFANARLYPDHRFPDAIVLKQTHSIAGGVTFEDGRPFTGAEVGIEWAFHPSSRHVLPRVAITGEDGGYTIDGLHVGEKYKVFASGPEQSGRGADETGWFVLRIPEGTNVPPLVLRPCDFTMFGRVLDDQGRAVPDARVILLSRSNRGRNGPNISTKTDSEGRFTVGELVPEDVFVSIINAGKEFERVRKRRIGRDDLSDVTIRLVRKKGPATRR